tara:strand:+ start:571 stop:690 length:120 start_codon:yes stop_codon:yes gene_type:complete
MFDVFPMSWIMVISLDVAKLGKQTLINELFVNTLEIVCQ